MSKVVLDIETIGTPFASLDEKSQEYLLRHCADEDERTAAREMTALWPVTGEIVTIGMLNPETGRGRVLFQAGGTSIPSWDSDGVVFQAGTEKEILEQFWADVASYNQVITFNGRGFDAPYLILRSAMLGVVITKNLMPPRFNSYDHLDLLEQFTFFGATRKFGLHLYCEAFGVKTPKGEDIDGSQVSAAYAAGDFVKIAEYNLRDLVATAALYKKWTAAMGGN